jgi:hypothetical protein
MSTVTVPFCTAGSTRATLPVAMPLRVSTSATCPMITSFACVSGDAHTTAFSFQGLRDARQVRPRTHLLPDLDRDLLQHAGDARAHLQRVHLLAPHARLRPRLLDRGPPCTASCATTDSPAPARRSFSMRSRFASSAAFTSDSFRVRSA